MAEVTFTGRVEPEPDDGGMALTAEIGDEGEFFVRLQSWSNDKRHPTMDALRGKIVRVTVEVVGE